MDTQIQETQDVRLLSRPSNGIDKPKAENFQSSRIFGTQACVHELAT